VGEEAAGGECVVGRVRVAPTTMAQRRQEIRFANKEEIESLEEKQNQICGGVFLMSSQSSR
jgi:hypothetical protein